MKLLVCLCAIVTIAYANVLEFKKVNTAGSIERFETAELERDEIQPAMKKRGLRFPCISCDSGYVRSKYCRSAARRCFRNGQSVYVKFKTPFGKPPHVTVGLTLIDTHKDQNVRVRVSARSITSRGFFVKFAPWDRSITYQLGVNWMACP